MTGPSLKLANWKGRAWHHPMSALGQKRTCALQLAMSALCQKRTLRVVGADTFQIKKPGTEAAPGFIFIKGQSLVANAMRAENGIAAWRHNTPYGGMDRQPTDGGLWVGATPSLSDPRSGCLLRRHIRPTRSLAWHSRSSDLMTVMRSRMTSAAPYAAVPETTSCLFQSFSRSHTPDCRPHQH